MTGSSAFFKKKKDLLVTYLKDKWHHHIAAPHSPFQKQNYSSILTLSLLSEGEKRPRRTPLSGWKYEVGTCWSLPPYRPLATLRNTQDLSEPDLTLNVLYCLELPSHCVALSLLLAFFLNGFETMFTAAIKRSALLFKPIWNLLGRLASVYNRGFSAQKAPLLYFYTGSRKVWVVLGFFCIF